MAFTDDIRNLDSRTSIAVSAFFIGLIAPGVLVLYLFAPQLVSDLATLKVVLLSISICAPGLFLPFFISMICAKVLPNSFPESKGALGTHYDWFLVHCINNAINFYLALTVSYAFGLSFGWFLAMVVLLLLTTSVIGEFRRMVKIAKGDSRQKSLVDDE